jgi:hypothetical protein
MPYPADQWIKGQRGFQRGNDEPAKLCRESLPGDVVFSLFFVPKWEHSGNFHLAKEKGLIFLAPKSF